MVSIPIPGDTPMFKVPRKYRPGKPAAPAEKWRSHKGKRETCGLCILDIRDGLMRVPMSSASLVYTLNGTPWYLCKQHGHEVKTRARRVPES